MSLTHELSSAEPKSTTVDRRSYGGWLTLILVIAVAWPILYSFYVQPQLARMTASSQASAAELQKFLGVHRYSLHVPKECDGWWLSFVSEIDGKEQKDAGSASVLGEEDLVIMVRRSRDSGRIEYGWFSDRHSSRGTFDDPFIGAGVTSERQAGPVKSGDWLILGDRDEISVGKDVEADFKLHIELRPPD